MIFSLFGVKCDACGKRVRDAMPASEGATMLCKTCWAKRLAELAKVPTTFRDYLLLFPGCCRACGSRNIEHTQWTTVEYDYDFHATGPRQLVS
jgi:hypothetical protein